MTPDQVAALSVPFPADVIKQKGGAKFKANYVDHGHVTERLLEVDPEWSWEPLGVTDDGLPAIQYVNERACLWGRMTVCGVTRIEVGVVDAHKDEVLKEAVSDFIKRGAMRFGVALHLWKGEEDRSQRSRKPPSAAAPSPPRPSTPPDEPFLDRQPPGVKKLDEAKRLAATLEGVYLAHWIEYTQTRPTYRADSVEVDTSLVLIQNLIGWQTNGQPIPAPGGRT